MQGVFSRERVHRQRVTPIVDGEAGQRALDPAAEFERQYRLFAGPVYGYCYRKLGSREAAEDATSLIFTKAYAALPSFHTGSFRAWLFTIAFHVITDDLRSRRANAELELVSDIAAFEPTPEDQAIGNERDDAVRTSIARLSESQRQVVELRMAGLNGREISEVLGRSLPAVKMTQLRAYARLRKLLASEIAIAKPETNPMAKEERDDRF